MSSPRKSDRTARDWVLSVLNEKLAAQRKRAREVLKPLAEKGKLTKGDVERAMGVLCFNHLAYCCGPKRKCGYRDELLRTIGMTKADYVRYKRRCEELLWSKLLKRGAPKAPA